MINEKELREATETVRSMADDIPFGGDRIQIQVVKEDIKAMQVVVALAEAYLEMSKEMPTVPELEWTALEDDDGVGMYFHGVSEIEEYSEACALSALKQKRELERMLEDLTPQGSEFHQNPEMCISYVKERLATTIEFAKKNKQLQAKLEDYTKKLMSGVLESMVEEYERCGHLRTTIYTPESLATAIRTYLTNHIEEDKCGKK